MYVKQAEDTRLPDWLREHLSPTCPHCGSPILNYYNDEDGRCTNRICSDFYCPGMVAARADNMRQLLNLKGLGFASCLKDVKAYGVKHPIELLPHWNIKPEVTIGLFLRLQCWEGVDSGLESEMLRNNITSLDELFERYDGKYMPLIKKHKDELYEYASLVKLPEVVQKKPPKATYTIMITGAVKGFNSKEQFIAKLNEACMGRIITIHQATKRQSNVDFLINDSGNITGKVNTAIKAGIPILTSAQYMAFLAEKIPTLK